jgi:septal ring factor EnvC (AmiA/AmiB activator)
MPSGRDINRLKSENRSLRAQVEALEAKPGALERQLEECQKKLVEYEQRIGSEGLALDSALEQTRNLEDRIGELEETLALRYEDWNATVAAEMGRREGALRAERVKYTTMVEEDLEDIDATEARLKALWEKIQERGRRKEVESVRADMNRAVIGCQRSRQKIEEKLAELRARAPQESIRDRMVISQPAVYPTERLRDRQEGGLIVLKSRLHEEDLTSKLDVTGEFAPITLPLSLSAIEEHQRWLDDGGPDLGGSD